MGIEISRLGFGLSSIAGSGNFSYQQNMIRTSIDCGITHFDVAPYYGSGDAEKILGNILSGCTEKVTITTKYGLLPLDSGKASGLLRSTLRPLFRQVPLLKHVASSVVSKVHQPKVIKYEKGALTTSIDNSIRNLMRPVDLILLHDPDIMMTESEELMEELKEVRIVGKASYTGISGSMAIIGGALTRFPENYQVFQLENSLTAPAPMARLLQLGANVITHRAIQGGLKALLFLMEKRPGFKNVWLRETRIDPTTDNLTLALIELALTENPTGTVLFSTTRVDRIKMVSSILTSPLLHKEGCKKIRALFDEVYISQETKVTSS